MKPANDFTMTRGTQVTTKKIPLEVWEKHYKEPTARLTGAYSGTLVRYELGAWAVHRLTAKRSLEVPAP